MLKRLVPVVIFCAALLSIAGCSSPSGSPAAPGANPPAKGKAGATGCGLVTASEVSQLTGVTFTHGISLAPVKVNPTALQPVALTESCTYKISDQVYVDYHINTLTEAASAYEPKVWSDDKNEEPSTTEFTVDGLPALGMPEEGENGRMEEVVFYQGNVVVQVNTGGVPIGASINIAKLLGKRLF